MEHIESVATTPPRPAVRWLIAAGVIKGRRVLVEKALAHARVVREEGKPDRLEVVPS